MYTAFSYSQAEDPVEVAEEITAYKDDEVEWGEDTSEEAQQKRMLELSAAAAGLALNADMEKTPQERADLFFQFVKVCVVCDKSKCGIKSGNIFPRVDR